MIRGTVKEFTNQGILKTQLHKLFSGHNILENVRKESKLKSLSNTNLELDFWIPTLQLAFEFQDPHHYSTIWYSNKSVEFVKLRDNQKVQKLKSLGETLVVVPCWWDGSIESLIATIRVQRKDLFPNILQSHPIPSEPPAGLFNVDSVPGVGELMLVSFATSSTLNPKDWWMSEKYDGIRVCWNPEAKQLYNKKGTAFMFADKILATFPHEQYYDGELWMGRSRFNELQTIGSDIFMNFADLRMIVLDCPLSNLMVEDRFAIVLSSIYQDHPSMIPVPQWKCNGSHLLSTFVNDILCNSGEGTIVKKFNSPYQHGISDLIYKYKAGTRDLEALVIEVDGNVILKLPNGITFSVLLCPTLPLVKIGDVVTFEYVQARQGRPIDAKVVKIRYDLSWDDVVGSFYHQNPLNQSAVTLGALNPSQKKPTGFWTINDNENSKRLLSDIALKYGKDPLSPDCWYSFSKDLVLLEGGGSLLHHYGGDFVRAVIDLFPDMNLNKQKLYYTSRTFWHSIENRKNISQVIAKNYHFDPFVAKNWQANKNIPSLVLLCDYYGGSLANMLVDLYPQVNWAIDFILPREHWRSTYNCKQFFDYLSFLLGFDALDFDKWKLVAPETVSSYLNGDIIMKEYGSLHNALCEAYHLDHSFFANVDTKTRIFFTNFAEMSAFDPLFPSNWYCISKSNVASEKDGKSVLSKYNGDLPAALIGAFPNIGIDPTLFINTKDFQSNDKRKICFDRFASSQGFDPLVKSNWSHLSLQNLNDKNCKIIIKAYYGNSISLALSDIYEFT